MRSILEQAVLHHLNGDDERATELFHQFIVARARSIHESMRNGDDPLVEGWDEEAVAEEFMATEDLDLAELEDGGEDEIDADMGAEGDMGDLGLDDEDGMGEEPGDDIDDEDAMGDIEADLDEPQDDAGLSDEVEALKAELEALTAEFEDMKAELGGEGEETDDVVSDDMGDDVDVAGEEPALDTEEDDDPFQAMGESLTSELEKVQVSMTDGKEIAAGGAISQQRKSALPQKKHDARQGGKPVEIRAKEHKGFEREAAPSVQSMKPRRNNVAKAKDALSPVKK